MGTLTISPGLKLRKQFQTDEIFDNQSHDLLGEIFATFASEFGCGPREVIRRACVAQRRLEKAVEQLCRCLALSRR